MVNTLGWSATTGEVSPWVYQQLAETYVLDPEMRAREQATSAAEFEHFVHPTADNQTPTNPAPNPVTNNP